MMKGAILVLAAQAATAFPFVAKQPGIDKDLLARGYPVNKRQSDTNCPKNPVHPGAVPVNDQYPYLSALNGNQSTGKGGIQVPAPGDTAHYFVAPGPLDIRGPCPGLNTLANHNFLSHDGLTTYNELVDAQQNVYNIGFGLANLLAIAGVGLTGDLITGRMSLGCPRDDWTNFLPGVLGYEGGLNAHNKFESDASLTRGDYFYNQDDHTFNVTMFQNMYDVTKGNYDRNNLALYRKMRYDEAVANNPNFFFGPGSLLMYGAASFLYGAFPSGGLKGNPDLATQMSFFGVSGEPGNFVANGNERIPDDWYSSVIPYDGKQIGPELFNMYLNYPVLFGGNVGSTGNFDALNITGVIEGGRLTVDTPENLMCFVYQTVTEALPEMVSTVYQLPFDLLGFVLGKLAPGYADLGCDKPLYPQR